MSRLLVDDFGDTEFDAEIPSTIRNQFGVKTHAAVYQIVVDGIEYLVVGLSPDKLSRLKVQLQGRRLTIQRQVSLAMNIKRFPLNP